MAFISLAKAMKKPALAKRIKKEPKLLASAKGARGAGVWVRRKSGMANHAGSLAMQIDIPLGVTNKFGQ